MTNYNINLFIILFTVYSFLGWCCEMVFCNVDNYIKKKKFEKRGILYGPYCPIYGFGALIILIFLSQFKNPITLFFVAIIATSFLEYFTSWGLEALFDIKVWDYSNHKFNIKGRVCLLNSSLFGLMAIVLIYFVNPVVSNILRILSITSINILASLFFYIFVTDMFISIMSIFKIKDKIREISNSIQAREAFSREFSRISTRFESLRNKYNNIKNINSKINATKAQSIRNNIYTIFFLFIAASGVGYFTDIIINYTSNTSPIISKYAPFSYMYGLITMVLLFCLYLTKDKKNIIVFACASLITIIFEFLSNLITIRGVLDGYSNRFFHSNSIEKIFYTILWGSIGLIIIKYVYPNIIAFTKKIPEKVKITLTITVVIFIAIKLVPVIYNIN